MGILVPIFSAMLFAMPPAGMLWPMVPELFIYGGITGVLWHHFKLPAIVTLLIAMVLGRVAFCGAILLGLSPMFTNPVNAKVLLNMSLVAGLPGVVAQIVIVPLLIKILLKRNIISQK